MVSVFSLWLPILLSAVVVFLASSLIHMVLGYHKNEFKMLPEEEKIREDLRKYNIPPGEYNVPHANDMKEMGTPEYTDKIKKGPVAFMTVLPNETPSMGKSLFQWFIYCIVVGIFAAYVAGRSLGPEAHYLSVFRFAGVTAFIGYSLALWQNTIWYKRPLIVTFKANFDGLIYALLTAGVFGWLWP